MTAEPSRLQRAWSAWLDSGSGDGVTNAELGDAIAEQLTDALVEQACEVMHDAYEQAAVGAGWDTNPASRRPWADVPPANQATMRAAVRALLEWLDQ